MQVMNRNCVWCLNRLKLDDDVGKAASRCADVGIFTGEVSWWGVVADGEVWRDTRAGVGETVGAVLSGAANASR